MTLIQERTRAAVLTLAVMGLVLSLLPIFYLHMTAAGEINPISEVVSDYIFVDGGAGLLALGSLTLAAASAALLLVLVARGVPRQEPAAWLLGLWSVGLVFVALFPTDPTGAPTTLSGAVHRYAGAVMFTSLPLAGWLLSRRNIPSSTVRRLSVAAGIASVAFMLVHVSVVQQGTSLVLLGLFERALFVLLYGLLFAVAAAVATRGVAP
jgi:hypothetical protein